MLPVVHSAPTAQLGMGRAPAFPTLPSPAGAPALDGAIACLEGWSRGSYSSTRSARTRTILAALEPRLLAAARASADAGETISSFDSLLRQLGVGTHLFASLAADPAALDVLLQLVTRAPRLAATLANRPDVFDALIAREPAADAMSAAEITRALMALVSRCTTDADVLRCVQQFARKHQFLIGAHAALGWMPLGRTEDAFSRLTLVVVQTLAALAERRLQKRNGRVPGSDWALVALGKFGAGELTATSDLDLMLVYEGADGERSGNATQYFNKLAQHIIAVLGAPAGDGALFETDFRLRPWGKKGPIATRLATLGHYLARDAWTYERMAMTRARVVTGSPRFAAAINAVLREALRRPYADGALRTDVLDMRAMMHNAANTANPWDLKHVGGGLIDIEFIAQYLTLQCAQTGASSLPFRAATADALRQLHGAELLSAHDFATLADAHATFKSVLQATRLACLPGSLPEGMSHAFAQALPAMVGEADLAALEGKLVRLQSSVREAFARLLAA
jgi:glutamate-ammonia-ligase adenylyltransferase